MVSAIRIPVNNGVCCSNNGKWKCLRNDKDIFTQCFRINVHYGLVLWWRHKLAIGWYIFKSHPLYLLHLITFIFYLFVSVYRSCYVSLYFHSGPLGGVVNVRETSCKSDAVQGFVPWRQKQQFARNGWYLSTKTQAEGYFGWIVGKSSSYSGSPTFNPQSEDRPSDWDMT
jgi:hypothetical protein